MIRTAAKYAAAGTLAVAACLIPHRLEAQSIANRVAAVRDGKVRMTFASRDDICGWGDGISTKYSIRNRNNNKGTWSNRSDDVDYGDECMAGPARIVLTLRDGKVAKIRSYVGGRWRPSNDARDLGTVPVREAVDYLFSVANRDDGKGSGEAIFATTLADSVDVSSRLASIAENESKSDDLRGQAIFWLGQSQTDNSGDLLRRLYKTIRDEDVKDKVIFSISQQNDEDSQDWLMDIASNSSESIENRKKALFWAGQTRTPFARLASMYDKTREREMKDQMIFVFSQRRESAALDKLMNIARHDPDRELRRKAMFWLGQSHDPRVSTFLADIINRQVMR